MVCNGNMYVFLHLLLLLVIDLKGAGIVLRRMHGVLQRCHPARIRKLNTNNGRCLLTFTRERESLIRACLYV